MRPIYLLSLLLLCFGCQPDSPQNSNDSISITWGHILNNFSGEPRGSQAYFVIDNPTDQALAGDWEIRFNAFMGSVENIAEGYEIVSLDGEYYALRPTASHPGIEAGGRDSIPYRSSGTTIKETMAPKGFFLLRQGALSQLDWQQVPMANATTFNDLSVPKAKEYDNPAALYANYPGRVQVEQPIIPSPNEVAWLSDDKVLWLTKYQGRLEGSATNASGSSGQLQANRIHLWFSGASWHYPMQAFKSWLNDFYGVELVIHAEEKPDFPHLELVYERTIEKEAYEIFNFSPELTVISASDPSGMLYGLATILQSLKIEDGQMGLPLAEVKDAPRFRYRGQHLDVSRNFQSKESVLRLLDLMALFKLNVFHFHLTDDEGWRLEIPGLPELTTVGATRGYTPDESDRINPAYGSGGTGEDPYGTGFYSRQDFVEILEYASARQIEVIPEIDLPGHARAAIKAMQAYEKRTGDASYRLNDPTDNSAYRSIQGYPDNVINVCQESTYNFLRKVVAEIDSMYTSANLTLDVLHTGGDEVPAGVWVASTECQELLDQMGATTNDGEEMKNILTTHFLNRFKEILDEQKVRTAGWEEIGMKRELIAENRYGWQVNPALSDQNFLTYVWNSQGENLDLGYRLANAGYEVVLCNVTNFYFDLAYTTDPAEGGLYWGGFVDTYKPWAFAPFDVAKTAPASWYQTTPTTEAELRSNYVPLDPAAQDQIVGIQGQLWSETVRGADLQERYLWPKMLGLAERAWSSQASWETMADRPTRQENMARDWQNFASRLGHFTLPLLEQYTADGINYRLPPPGAILENGQLKMKAAFPGLPLFYAQGEGEATSYEGPTALDKTKGPIRVWTGSKDGERKSVVLMVE